MDEHRSRPRGWRLAAAAFVVVGAVVVQQSLRAAPPPPSPVVRAEPRPALTVADVDRAAEFYATVLLFERVVDDRPGPPDSAGRLVRMRLGDETLDLVENSAGRARATPDLSPPLVVVVNDIEQACLWLRRHGVEPVVATPACEGGPETNEQRVLFFTDPDGHRLGLVQFPPEKGESRWQRPVDRVFLGIARPMPGASPDLAKVLPDRQIVLEGMGEGGALPRVP